jgi:hypothetical protein
MRDVEIEGDMFRLGQLLGLLAVGLLLLAGGIVLIVWAVRRSSTRRPPSGAAEAT